MSRWVLPTALYSIFAILFTYPGVKDLPHTLIGLGDAIYWLWMFDWVHHAFPLGYSVLSHPTVLLYPDGFNLTAAYDGVLGILISLPLSALTKNPILTYNLTLLLAFSSSCLAMYGLALSLTRHRFASFLAGFTYGFSPMMLARGEGQMNLMFTAVIPLTILATRYFLEKRSFRSILFLGMSLFASAVSSFYFAITSAMAAVVLIVGRALWDSKSRTLDTLFRFSLAVGIAVVLTIPLVAPLLTALHRGEVITSQRSASILFSADLTSFFVPAINSTFLGRISQKLATVSAFDHYELTTSLGPFTLILALFAFWRYRRNPSTWEWFLLTLAGVVLALGPVLTVFNKTSFFGDRLTIVLPFAFLNLLPILHFAWAPARFTYLAYAGISVLLGIFFADIFRRLRPPHVAIITAVLLAVLTVERISVPYPTTREPDRGVLLGTVSGADPLPAIAVLPAKAGFLGASARTNYLQVLTQQSFTDGYLPAKTNTPAVFHFIDGGPLASFACQFFSPNSPVQEFPPVPSESTIITSLHSVGIGFVLVYPWASGHPLCKEAAERITRTFSTWPVVETTNWYILYRVPAVSELNRP